MATHAQHCRVSGSRATTASETTSRTSYAASARPDIRVTIGLRTFYIDVSVENPAAQSYVLAAVEVDEAAATQRAHEKRLRYSDALATRARIAAFLHLFLLAIYFIVYCLALYVLPCYARDAILL
jgi:hypothetical protein